VQGAVPSVRNSGHSDEPPLETQQASTEHEPGDDQEHNPGEDQEQGQPGPPSPREANPADGTRDAADEQSEASVLASPIETVIEEGDPLILVFSASDESGGFAALSIMRNPSSKDAELLLYLTSKRDPESDVFVFDVDTRALGEGSYDVVVWIENEAEPRRACISILSPSS